jgi:hypothetical protein
MSEFGGEPGIIQPDIDGVPEAAAAAGLGHASDENRAADRRGVRDAAMVVRRAGMREAAGKVVETITDPETGVASFVQYDEATAREDLVGSQRDRGARGE